MRNRQWLRSLLEIRFSGSREQDQALYRQVKSRVARFYNPNFNTRDTLVYGVGHDIALSTGVAHHAPILTFD